VPPDEEEEDRPQGERRAIEDNRGALASAIAERFGQDRRGERQERDRHQQQGVAEEQNPVGRPDVVEHGVVVGPDLADQQERERVGQVGRPQLEQPSGEMGGIEGALDLQHQDGRRDREHAVAELQQPGCGPFAPRSPEFRSVGHARWPLPGSATAEAARHPGKYGAYTSHAW
jgi:hypothetical protein